MLETIVAKETGYLTLESGSQVALLVNNLGGSTLLEAYAVLNTALQHLRKSMKVGIARTLWLNHIVLLLVSSSLQCDKSPPP